MAQETRFEMWRKLADCIRLHFDLQQGFLGGQVPMTMKEEPGGHALAIRRYQLPIATIDCRFLDKKGIAIFFSYQKTDNAETVKWEDHIDLPADEIGRVQFQKRDGVPIDTQTICLAILLPVRDLLNFNPPTHAQP